MYAAIGAMAMPLDFKYKRVLQRGRPKHEKYDEFYRKHPPMEPSRWAKIFAPFDALHILHLHHKLHKNRRIHLIYF